MKVDNELDLWNILSNKLSKFIFLQSKTRIFTGSTILEVRIFYHKAKLRVPYRQQNICNLYDIKTSEKQMERQKSNGEDNDNVQLHTPSGSFDSNTINNTYTQRTT